MLKGDANEEVEYLRGEREHWPTLPLMLSPGLRGLRFHRKSESELGIGPRLPQFLLSWSDSLSSWG